MKLQDVIEHPELIEEKHVSETNRVAKKKIERPDHEVELKSIAVEEHEMVKTQKDPTDDLVVLPRVKNKKDDFELPVMSSGYIVQDKDTGECWYAHDELCLNKNFIYRDDLIIKKVADAPEAVATFYELMDEVNVGQIPNTVKYILDDPGSETYEVYCDSSYPSRAYGKATPTGMFVSKYPNRFHRDMAICQLDIVYAESSKKKAAELTAKKLKPNEAIIISDGAWMRETSAYCYYYLDDKSIVKCCEGCIPSEPDQAVLISEINGAYYALQKCMSRKKKYVTYYYDNTSILNVFKNRKTEYIDEIKRYKELCDKMLQMGYVVEFRELHPKSDENKDVLNKALTFFHNTCDEECRKMSMVFKKNYKDYATANTQDGKKYSEFKKDTKPKGKPKYSR